MGGGSTPVPRRPHIIVVGNEKGGTGKSTTAMHLIVALLGRGLRTASVDLDARQGTLSRYLENRVAYSRANDLDLPVPDHRMVAPSDEADRGAAEADERRRFDEMLAGLADHDAIVIDSPGSDSSLARLAHEFADTLITPLNDSFLDIDVLARIDPERREVLAPSVYTRMVWEYHNRRIVEGREPIDWVVMRNRLTHIDARNKRDIERLLVVLGERIGFRLATGFGERVIFRELFPKGLTLLDPADVLGAALPGGNRPRPSHVAALREIEELLRAIGLPEAGPEDSEESGARRAFNAG